MSSKLSLSLKNQRAEVSRAGDALKSFLEANGVDAKVQNDVLISIEELLTNIVSYGYAGPGEREIRVEARLDPSQLEIEIGDDGRPFDLLTHPKPDTELPLDEKPIGGLGILMIRESMDEVTYERRDGRNIVLLRKML